MFFAINPITSNAKVSGRCLKVKADGLLNENDRNLNAIICRRCGSIIFPEDVIGYIEGFPKELRVMTHQAAGDHEYEKVSWWWYTSDDMDFDTVGWQTVDKKKVLMCGDCELGPIGFRNEESNKFWVAVERVSYKEDNKEDDDEESDESEKEKTKNSKSPCLKSPAKLRSKSPISKSPSAKSPEKPHGPEKGHDKSPEKMSMAQKALQAAYADNKQKHKGEHKSGLQQIIKRK